MTKEAQEIRKLIDKLNYYTELYDKGEPEISDKEWDDLYFQLEQMEKETNIIFLDSPTQSIQFVKVSKLNKIKHNHPMLSLDKTKNIEVLKQMFKNIEYLAMCKMDGLTCSLTYQNGKLVRAETRGNGEEGEDILHNAKIIKSIPIEIPYKEELIIDGEIISTIENFKKWSETYKNPRNFAAGSIRLLDAKECAARNLIFIAWDMVKGKDINSFAKRLTELSNLGFLTVPYSSQKSIDNCENQISSLKETAELLGYPIDGIVFKFDDKEYGDSLGTTSHHRRNAISYKFYDEEYETELIDIEWSLSRNGTLTPIAIFNSIEINDTTVEKASLHNISIMRDILGLYPKKNQKIWVIKANMIIPQISKAIKNDTPNEHILENGIIRFCPICGAATKIITSDSGTETLICTSNTCNGKLINILDHFCSRKGLEIKGLSKATLEKLIDWGLVSSIEDIFSLKNNRKIWINKEGFGEKSVDKILKAIEDSSKNCELWRVISAAGIPLVGPTIAKSLAEYFKTWENFRKAVTEKMDFSELENFGEAISNSILNFNYEHIDNIANNLIIIKRFEEKEENNNILEGKIFCLTGKSSLGSRNKVKELIEAAGGRVSNSVTFKTNYLLANKEENTTKYNNAKKLNIKIISDDELANMLN